MASAIVLAKAVTGEIDEQSWEQAGWLPCQLSAEIAIRNFSMGDLLSLELGAVIDTAIPVEDESSVKVNGVRIGSGKLDTLGDTLALRLSEIL